MADGVDIDLYADVDHEFAQVVNVIKLTVNF